MRSLLPRTLPLALGFALSLGGAGCENGSCKVVTASDGTRSLLCPDGSSAPLGGGAAGGTLVRIDAEPAGPHCASGGTAIHTGVDKNADAVLEDGEVTATQYVCNGGGSLLGGTLDDSYTLRSAVDAALIADVAVITGTLTVQAPGLTELTLSRLTRIDGDLIIDGDEQLKAVKLPSLAKVGGSLTVANDPLLTELALPALTSVGSTLDVRSNAKLATLTGLVGLTSVGGTLYVRANPSLVDLAGLAALTSAHALEITQDETLASLAGVAGLTTLPGGLLIANDPAIIDLTGLDHLTTAGLVRVNNNVGLTSLHGLEKLATADGVQVDDDTSLTSVAALAALTSTHSIAIDGNSVLASLAGLEQLTALDQDLSIQNNPTLTSLAPLSHLSAVRSLYVSGNTTLATLGLAMLTSVTLNFTVADHPALKQCLVDALVGQLTTVPTTVSIANNAGAGSCS